MNSKTMMMAILGAGALIAATQAQAADVNVTADITGVETWTSGNTYWLTKPIFVRDSGDLTIQPGTVVRGYNTTPPGALIVARGNQIHAVGTPSMPIVFTGSNDNHFVGPTPVAGSAPWSTPNNGISKQWGGLLVLGDTYLATDHGEPGTPSPNASLELQIEGLTPYGVYGKYGGGDDNDDSGELSYISIRYGGYVLGGNNEINGLTLGAVGRGTQIDHIEVFQNKDDGVEFFGGTVNTKFMVVWAVADDSFDYDEGFRGKGQFWFTVQGALTTPSDVSDKAFEWDGSYGNVAINYNDDSAPLSVATIFNATLVGQGRSSANNKNTAIHMRDGAGGRIYNSMVMDFGGACALIEGRTNGVHDSGDMSTINYTTDAYYTHSAVASALNRKLEINRVLFWKMGTNVAIDLPIGSGTADNWGASGEDENYPHYGYPLFTFASLKNQYRTASTPPIMALERDPVATVVSSKNYYNVTNINPTAASTIYLTSGLTPPSDSFFTPVKFLGAMGQLNWAAPWTCAFRKGLITAEYDASSPVAVALVNGSKGNLSVPVGTPLALSGKFIEDIFASTAAGEYWLLLEDVTGGGANSKWYNKSRPGATGWRAAPLKATHVGQMQDITGFSAGTVSSLTVGTWKLVWGWDSSANDVKNAGHFGEVTITVTP